MLKAGVLPNLRHLFIKSFVVNLSISGRISLESLQLMSHVDLSVDVADMAAITGNMKVCMLHVKYRADDRPPDGNPFMRAMRAALSKLEVLKSFSGLRQSLVAYRRDDDCFKSGWIKMGWKAGYELDVFRLDKCMCGACYPCLQRAGLMA